ncbi:MAG TPA: cytidylate kinase-like family protein [Rectinemataceae bacterium]|nr:cytidylate kinase-like family protein [Rectinemataceae bacterium]
MGVITFSREPCSGGTLIAESVAAELGYTLVDKKTIEAVLIQYGFVGLRDAYDSMPNFWTRFDEETRNIVMMFDRVVLAMAKLGDVVIMGRGAFKVLEPYRDALNVRIKSPFETRVATFMKRYGCHDRAFAENELTQADKLRASFLEIHYGFRGDSTKGFDLVIDSSKIAPNSAATLVMSACRSLSFPNPASSISTASIEADNILIEAARRVLKEM